MNIFVLHTNPITAARMMCDKHIPKMVVESAQMMASALRRHGAADAIMPIAKTTGRPYLGGYHRHPCTVWTGDTRHNFLWLAEHGSTLAAEYTSRYGKVHACAGAIEQMTRHASLIPTGPVTEFAQAMPDEFKVEGNAVLAYRRYYSSDKRRFASWTKGTPAPSWWDTLEEDQ